jgi:hypothetical protein
MIARGPGFSPLREILGILPRVPAHRKKKTTMATFLLSTLLLFTIVAAFAFGVAMGYWVICGILNLFHPTLTQNKPSSAPALVPTVGGD